MTARPMLKVSQGAMRITEVQGPGGLARDRATAERVCANLGMTDPREFNLAFTAILAARGDDARLTVDRERSGGEWQPIKTAPKDGTEVLGCDDEGIRQPIRWSKHNHVPLYGWVRQVELYGEEVDGFDAVWWTPLPAAPAPALPETGVGNG